MYSPKLLVDRPAAFDHNRSMVSLGIDFGTSTTVVARYSDGVVSILPDREGLQVTPSYLAFTPSGDTVFGSRAAGRRVLDPANTIFSFKRILGKPWTAMEVKDFSRRYPYTLVPDADQQPHFQTRAGSFTAEQITARFLAAVVQAYQLADMGVSAVTMTVPTAFDASQRAALQRAAIAAGLPEPTLLDEPVAAWLAYMSKEPGEQRVVVYDLGGGTFDVAILRSVAQHFEVLAVDGDPYLGADDIDLACATWAAAEILATHRWDVTTSIESFQRLVTACEKAKVKLSRAEEHHINLSPIDVALQGQSLQLPRSQLEKLCMDLVRQSFIICDQAVRRSGVPLGQLDTVVLSGGGSHMPIVQRGVMGYFKQEPQAYLPPDRIVALGAALHAGGHVTGDKWQKA